MTDIDSGTPDPAVEPIAEPMTFVLDDAGEVQVRSASKRELDIRIMPWRQVVRHQNGLEAFVPGAFADIEPSMVRLLPPTDDGKHRHLPVGRGLSIEERADAAYMTFKVARTQLGDELLALAEDGVITGASVGFIETPGGSHPESVQGHRVRVHERVGLDHVAITWKPAYQGAGIVAMRSAHEKGEGQMAEAQEAAAAAPATPNQPQQAAPVFDLGPLADALRQGQELQQRSFEAFTERLSKLEERGRSDFTIPPAPEQKKPTLANWSAIALRMMTGQPVTQKELQERVLDDVVTTENPGLVPDALRTDLLIGVINRRRPFLESTTQITAPDTGMSIVVPKLTQRSATGVQATEKAEVASQAMRVSAESFDAVTIAGAADVSIQMIRRADPSFMDLLIRDLGHDYARKADVEALEALFAAGTTVGTGNIDPEDLLIGEAWENSMSATDEPPDTIWLSAAGVSAFINAKNDGTNSPLYFNLNSAFSVGGGPNGAVSALRPVYVPALDAMDVDVMIGPSSGFAWAEDGAIRLEADVPAKAGRDIGLVGILFFVPRYPAAFTTYELGS